MSGRKRADLEDDADDTDKDYMRDTIAYIEALLPGGELAEDLVTVNGTRIADHIDHFYVQSWGVNPLSNLWYMEELVHYLNTR